MTVRMSIRRSSDDRKLELGRWASLLLWVLLSHSFASAQNDCTVTPPTGTCATPPPTQAWCAGNNVNSTCAGGTSWIGFSTSSPAAGSWSNQF